MDIVNRLPSDRCENCRDFLLDVNEQTAWLSDGGSHLILTVWCRNFGKCKHLKHTVKRAVEDDAGRE